MTTSRATLYLAAVLALAACAPQQDTLEALADDDVQMILSLDRAFQTAMQAENFEAFRTIYAADAVSMPPGSPAIHGIDSIIAWHNEAAADITYTMFDTDSDVVDGDDTVGYQYGTFSAAYTDANGDEVTTQGKFMWILRRGDTGWAVVADIWNGTPQAGM